MFRVAICDDIPTTCLELKEMIVDFCKTLIVEMEINIFYSGEALISDINEVGPYDLVFLDIELGRINGIEVGHIIREQMDDYNTKIIYISSKSNYDRQLFDVQPLHFLQKPLDKNKVIHDIRLAMKIANRENKSFEFRISRQVIKVPYKDILYFESIGREIKLVCGSTSYKFYESIQNLNKLLPEFFIYPHRSYIVNYEHINHFKYDKLLVSNGETIPISQNKRKEIRELQMKFEKEKLWQI